MSEIQGIYLVVDPSLQEEILFKKLEEALRGGVQIVQLWDHWPECTAEAEKINLVKKIHKLTQSYNVPFILNQNWTLALYCAVDGVHFDAPIEEFPSILAKFRQDAIFGVTISNEKAHIHWAQEHKLDYISFCSVFPSSSVDTCEIVQPETVKYAQDVLDIPIFLSGGINLKTIEELSDFNFDGVAIISGIMGAENTQAIVSKYQKVLKNLN